ncbi:MAG TPA: MFS transporter [Anaerolineales bacterium]|nr:MFS transporter [Anaerolineales bacterium]
MNDSSLEATAAAPPSLWRNRDFMLLWSGQVVSTLGGVASAVVLPLLVLAITDSPTAAGIAGALWSLPYLLFSLPVGALIDRWDRKRVMILCDIGRALLLGSIPIAMALNALTIWQLYITQFLEGTLFVFFNIAEAAALPRVVAKSQLPEASAQNEAAFGVAGILGPSIGAFLYQSISRAIPFIMDSVSYAASVISLTLIRARLQAERTATNRNLRAEIVEGVSWLWRQPLIRFMAFLTGGINLVFAANGLILIVLAKRLGAGDAVIGILFSVGAVGTIVGSLIGGWVQKRFSFGQVITVVIWIIFLSFPFYAIAPHTLVLGIIAAVLALTIPIYNVVQFSYRLALIPDELQGRVNSAFRLIAFGFQPLGVALAGALLEGIGSIPTVMLFSAWLLGLGILTMFNKRVREAPPIEQAQFALRL